MFPNWIQIGLQTKNLKKRSVATRPTEGGEKLKSNIFNKGKYEVPSPFWKVLGPRIFCLIFGSRNAYFSEFYGPFNSNSMRKNISEKIIPLL